MDIATIGPLELQRAILDHAISVGAVVVLGSGTFLASVLLDQQLGALTLCAIRGLLLVFLMLTVLLVVKGMLLRYERGRRKALR